MKLKNLYNLEAFKTKFLKSGELAGFGDAAPGIVIKENLKHIDPKIFEKKFPELVFLNSGFTANNTGGYAKIIQSLRTQPSGSFALAGDRSDNKGKITVEGEDSQINVYEHEAQSSWSDSEIKEANLQGINLQQDLVSSHMLIYQREVDQIIATGVNGKSTSLGLLNNTAFSSTAASGAIGTLTPQQMYDEVSDLILAQHNAVQNTVEYMANRVIMPVRVYNTLARTILNAAGSTKSVLKSLQDNYPDIQFLMSFRAESVSGSSRTVAYSTNEQASVIRIPVPLSLSEITRVGFKYMVESKYRIAGLDILEATSGYILTGL